MFPIFLELLVKPAWKWFISIPLEIIGVAVFINPSLQKWNWPMINTFLPWYGWVICGLVIWGVATALEAAKRINELRDTSSSRYSKSPHIEGDHVGDIVYGDKIEGKKKESQRKEANFRLEPCRSDIDAIGITVFNDEDVDFTEKSAELLGFGKVRPDGTLLNMIDGLGHERRGLVWFEKENKIVSGGHSLVEVTVVDWQGIHLNSMIVEHNTDEAIWKVGIEIRGKLNDYPIIPKSCCLTFVVRKNISNNKREIWVVGQPKLSNGDCDWVKTISATEWIEQNEKRP